MTIIDDLLETTCKNVINAILGCLENSTKGTIYRIGPAPELRATRVASGVRVAGQEDIRWGFPATSDYNPPGKTWEQYRDRPGHVLEAMGWCVGKQLSWTAENPWEDERSVGKQLRGEVEDVYHMEPVLVRKSDMYGARGPAHHPVDYHGNEIWLDTAYVVAAVIKIHFIPGSLKRGDRATRLIEQLSRTLGTELLSIHLRESLAEAQKQFDKQRIQSCMIIAHELRNTLIKFGFLFTAINAQIAVLREAWEKQINELLPEKERAAALLLRLSQIARSVSLEATEGEDHTNAETLVFEQDELRTRSMLPIQRELWINARIQPKWERILDGKGQWRGRHDEVHELISLLRKSFNATQDPVLIEKLTNLPPDLRKLWGKVASSHFGPDDTGALSDALELLNHPDLPLPHKQQINKILKSLKVLVDVIPEVEEKANKIIRSLRDGDAFEGLGHEYTEHAGKFRSISLALSSGREDFRERPPSLINCKAD